MDGLECNVCNNNSVYKSTYMYLNNTDYLICNLNRVLFEETLNKDKSELFINNRITFKNIDIASTNTIKTNDYVLDLKTVICQNGTLSNGHYICLNKNANNSFDLYDDNKKYIVTLDKFYLNTLFKSNVCNLVYQLNNVNSPLSDILLLEYENDYLNEQITDTFINYVKNNNRLGINISPPIISGGSSQVMTNTNNNILIKLFNLDLNENKKNYIDLLNDFFKNIKDITLVKEELINNLLTDYYDTNISIILPRFEELYIYMIHKFTFSLIDKLIHKTVTPIEFLDDTSLFKTFTNINIGTSGYNTSKTNHWDVIYEISSNNLELYSNHFNSIEINDTYYHDFDDSYWSYLEDKLKSLNSTNAHISVSVVLNKKIMDVFLNDLEDDDELTELTKLFMSEFDTYYNTKIEKIEDYLHNIVFILIQVLFTILLILKKYMYLKKLIEMILM